MEKSDNDLVADYLTGDAVAFEILVSRYVKQMYAYAFRLCGAKEAAEDITQETFLKAWRGIKRFDLKRNFKVWLYTIARNASYDYLRKKKPILFSEMNSADDEAPAYEDTLVDTAPLQDEVFTSGEDKAIIDKTVDELHPKDKEVIVLRHQSEMTFEEIAEALDEPMNTVKSRYRRALMKMKNSFAMHQKNP